MRGPFSAAAFLARTDARLMLREKETIVWTFVMPIVFFYFIGTVTGGFGGGGDPERRDAIALHAPAEAGALVDALVERLEREDYLVVRVETEEELAPYWRRLRVPADFTSAVAAGEPRQIRFERTGSGSGVDFDELRVARATYTLLADVILSRRSVGEVSPLALAEVAQIPRTLVLETRSAGRRRDPPQGFEQTVPGTMVMFTMMLLLTSGAITLLIERKRGLLRRLASAPIPRGAVVLGKWGGKMALALVQLLFAMVAGTVLFEMDWGSGASLAMLLLLVFCWAAFNASLGILVASLARTEGQAVGGAVIGTMVLAALGGCWWPIEITPRWMQDLAMFLPTGWMMDAMHRLVSFRDDPSSVWPHVIAVATSALFLGWLATKRFRFE